MSSPISIANALSISDFRDTYLISSAPGSGVVSNVDEIDFAVEVHTAESLSQEDFESCFELIRETSARMYRRSEFGWKPAAKKREMRNQAMRYLLLRSVRECDTKDESERFAGFLSFMLTIDNDDPVAYCYEIHLIPSARGYGLGRYLMGLVERVGRGVGVDKAMLTVFTSNEAGLKFYENIG
jgi:ribosomal protein S18 acetylase RimI-like enzyme